MIPDDKALEDLVLGALANELQNGQVLVDMSTVSPTASRRCASRLDGQRTEVKIVPTAEKVAPPRSPGVPIGDQTGATGPRGGGTRILQGIRGGARDGY